MLSAKHLRGKGRIVNSKTGRVEKCSDGNAVDGGGYQTMAEAVKQAIVLRKTKANK